MCKNMAHTILREPDNSSAPGNSRIQNYYPQGRTNINRRNISFKFIESTDVRVFDLEIYRGINLVSRM